MPTRPSVLALTLTLALTTVSASAPLAAAQDVHFVLFGDGNKGWGTSAVLSKPGPPLTVDQGDNVTLTLSGADTSTHNWFIDYDNDSTDDAEEPNSPNFVSPTPINWNFIANRTGTFTYRCKNHAANMYGSLTVREGGGFGGFGGFNQTIFGVNILVFVGVIAGALIFIAILARLGRRRRAS